MAASKRDCDPWRTSREDSSPETGSGFAVSVAGRWLRLHNAHVPRRSALVLAIRAIVLAAVLAAVFPLALGRNGGFELRPASARVASSPLPISISTLEPLKDGARDPGYQLALESASVRQEGDEWIFQGTVRNLTGQPISDLLAEVTLYGPDKMPQASVDAPLKTAVLPPGGTARWEVQVRRIEDSYLYNIRFLRWHVGEIPTRDARQ